jgi:hypothetical protein
MVFKNISLLFCAVFFLAAQANAVEESLLVNHEHTQLTAEQKKARKEARAAKQSQKIYQKVKNKTWDQLSSKEKAFAKKHGIPDAATYDAWKAQQAAIAAEKKAKKELQIYAKVKDKEWSDLSRREIAYAKKNGIGSKEEYDAWKAKQALLAANPMPLVDPSLVMGDRTPASTQQGSSVKK